MNEKSMNKKHTKIIVTLGPATNTEKDLRKSVIGLISFYTVVLTAALIANAFGILL